MRFEVIEHHAIILFKITHVDSDFSHIQDALHQTVNSLCMSWILGLLEIKAVCPGSQNCPTVRLNLGNRFSDPSPELCLLS